MLAHFTFSTCKYTIYTYSICIQIFNKTDAVMHFAPQSISFFFQTDDYPLSSIWPREIFYCRVDLNQLIKFTLALTATLNIRAEGE